MNEMTRASYRPDEFRQLTFHDVVAGFRDGSDSPRAYLERCLETIAAREPVVRAWVVMNEAGARRRRMPAVRAGRQASPSRRSMACRSASRT
jgi:hypothetical protein